MKKIKLTHGQFALVDDWNYEWLSQWKWQAQWDSSTGWYARRRTYEKGTQVRGGIRMSRQIMKAGPGDMVDHINHRSLDNREANLRFVTPRQNCANRTDQSKYGVGISVEKRLKSKPWGAQIQVHGKLLRLGRFSTIEEAKLVRRQAEIACALAGV